MTITGIGSDLADDKCFSEQSENKPKDLTKAEKERCTCLGSQLFKQCEFPGLKAKYNQAVDKPEPDKPEAPGEFQSDPREFETYKNKLSQYKKDVNSWQVQYSEWKEKRESAIGEAEGIIRKFHEDYGSAFKVNVVRHWGILGILMAAMFALLLLVQKRKDIPVE